MYKLLQQLEHDAQLRKADVVKGLIVQIKKDVLDDKREELRRDIQDVMRLAG